VVCDPGSNRAVIEWTVRRTGALARGAEWYEFDPGTGLITEIRACLASPLAAGASRVELAGFPYACAAIPISMDSRYLMYLFFWSLDFRNAR
jgi:hypothetical protein